MIRRARARRVALLVAVTVAVTFALAAIAGATAPPYSHLDAPPAGDNSVTVIGADASAHDPFVTSDIVAWSTSSSHQTRDYAHHTIVDYRTGGADGVSRTALHVSGTGVQNGIQRAHIGYLDVSTSWDDWHYRGGLKIEQAQFVADTTYIGNEGDDVKFNAGSQDSRVSRSWLDQSRDDCVQGDYGQSAVLESVLATNCYNALSARPSGTIDATGKTLTVTGSVIDVTDSNACYNPTKYGCPNHAGWLKWSGNASTDLGLAISGTTLVADSYPEIGNLALNARIVSCSGVTLDYRGAHTGADWTNWLADKATWQFGCASGLTIHDNSDVNHNDADVDYVTKVAAWHSTYDAGLG